MGELHVPDKVGKTLCSVLLQELFLPSVCPKWHAAACVSRVLDESPVHREWRRKSVDASFPPCGLRMESASIRGSWHAFTNRWTSRTVRKP